MSYANGTPNFNLPQTISTDKRDWSDTNQAFLNVDAALKAAGDNAIIADGKADAAQTTADSAATTATSAVTTANSASATAQTAAETAQLAQNAATTAQQTATQAATDAQSAITTANAAQSNIGNMANLQTTDKTSLVAAINEIISQIGGGSMPILNYANPLHTFSAGNLTFTATKECYIAGNLGPTGAACILTINGTNVAYNGYVTLTPDNRLTPYISPIKIKNGDVVTVNSESAYLHIFEEVSN